ncbi:hypothetical protein SPBR_05226 [Sporothrix brasiliensis 5110]|uniref:Uncharacterized protein n=1 Tax=Sporothrix brasiliensis 5110 TaxID=1398154 RepID=A0A0C2IDC2_9PEZI|nr:uncharacterized protein SPBR_05226 [Sporothrix brasiliensis 5110]KIH87271.1 hypothetical protein SPBR_05226 [Sporothrix brasiliensis 5110]
MIRALTALSLAGASLAASVPATVPAGVPAGSHSRPKSLPFPDIAAITANTTLPKHSHVGLQRDQPKGTTASSSRLGRRDDYCKTHACVASPTLTWGDADNGGKGIHITNAGSDWRGFYIFQNCCDLVPYKYIWIAAGETQFVTLPGDFQGRIQRGVDSTMLSGQSNLLGTWFEFSWDANGAGWADISLIRGCDGAALIWDTDNGNEWMGFTQWILDGAPTGAYDMKNDGQWVLAASEALGNPADVNTLVRDWYIQQVGTDRVYVDDWHGNGAVMESPTGRISSYWPEGRA